VKGQGDDNVATEKTKKVFWYSAWGLLFVGLAGVLIKQAFEETPEPSKPSYLSDLIILTARTTARNWMVNEDIRFDRAEAANSHAIKFYYTLVNYDTQPDSFDLDATFADITEVVCAAQMSKGSPILTLGGTLIYIFGSKNEKEVGRFEIDKQTCAG
jgi:hypothetical protein